MTKRGCWLGRPVQRWCQIEQDHLVYYASLTSRAPKGKIPLAECALSRDFSDKSVSWPLGELQSQALELVRPGKSPCLIHADSPEEMAALAAYLRSKGQHESHGIALPCSSRPLAAVAEEEDETAAAEAAEEDASQFVSDVADEDLTGDSHHRMPNSSSPSVEPLASAGLMPLHSRGFSREAKISPRGGLSDASVNVRLGPDLAARVTSRASSIGNASEWSADVGDESYACQDSRFDAVGDASSQSFTTAGGSSSSTSSSNSYGARPPRQFKAAHFASVASSLGPKLAYRKAMQLMWNYDLDAARALLEPWRSSVLWHAGAYAECSALRAGLTGRKSEALATLELVKTAEALQDSIGVGGLAHDVFGAEMLLLRSGLQVMLGARLRALYNLRQCWVTYHRLEQLISDEAAFEAAMKQDEVNTSADIRGRVLFGLGLFYLAASLVPASFCPLMRLAGFVMHRQRGKAYLFECVERDLGTRAIAAAICLSMYHLDLEPDIPRAGNLLVASLGRQPENVLLHWAGSLLAWRNTFISQAVEMTGKALWCCGEELGGKAVYLRYELGMFHFIAMDWPLAYEHLHCVYESVHADQDKAFFPYRTLVTTQLAAVAFSMGQHVQGEALCRECGAVKDWSGLLKMESDFSKVLQIFVKRRHRHGRSLLAFEVMYLLRQFPKVPAPMLEDLQAQVQKVALPFRRVSASQASVIAVDGPSEAEAAVELASALTVQTVIRFYLGDATGAMELVPELSQLCPSLPIWASYISAHGLYWCGRVLALNSDNEEARLCLQQAKAYKKYPFNIGVKIAKVLAEHEEQMSRRIL